MRTATVFGVTVAGLVLAAALVARPAPTQPQRPATNAGPTTARLGVPHRRARFAHGEGDERTTAAAWEYANRAYPAATIGSSSAALALRPAEATARAFAPSKTQPRWFALGPAGVSGALTGLDPNLGGAVSGRVTALAVVPGCSRRRCTVLLGSAGGGLWRTDDGLGSHPHWRPIASAIPSSAIGSIVVDPSDRTTIYVGTGEPNGSNDSEAGVGIWRSGDGGVTWHALTSWPFIDMAVASIAVDPVDSDILYAGTSLARHGASAIWGGRSYSPRSRGAGLYRSLDRGRTWQMILQRPHAAGTYGAVTRVLLNPADRHTVYAAVSGYGLQESTDGGRRWRQVLAVPDPHADDAERIDVDVSPARPSTMYAYVGHDGGDLWRSTNARSGRPRLVKVTSTNPVSGTSDAHGLCADQCSYDLVVRADPRRPNVVYVGGSASYDDITGTIGGTLPYESNGRILVRSTDGGRSWSDVTLDGSTRGLHPDMHALAFAADSRIWFAGSDGGIWRSDGRYVDHSGDCIDRALFGPGFARCERRLGAIPRRLVNLNAGLATLQFQGVALDRNHGLGLIVGGTQDNGTEVLRGGRWANVIFGDGGPAAIGTDGQTIWHTYTDASPEVSLSGGGSSSWVFTGDPLIRSGELASFYVPLQADRVSATTAYVGLEHVWRTADAGGMTGADAANVALHCNELQGTPDPSFTCGDWTPLGAPLTSGGGTKAGEFVTWITQSPDNPDIAWAGTRAGRVFETLNLRAPVASDVVWSRIDSDTMPNRFVSGIVPVTGPEGMSIVAFSGYGANTLDLPGHVYSVTPHRLGAADQSMTTRDISFNLPDVPVTALAIDHRNNDLYAATDIGVFRLPGHGTRWTLFTSGLPRVAVYSLEVHERTHTLVAGTHGRGVWAVRLA